MQYFKWGKLRKLKGFWALHSHMSNEYKFQIGAPGKCRSVVHGGCPEPAGVQTQAPQQKMKH